MQLVLTIIAVVSAVAYLGYMVYKKFFSKNTACDSCAFGKANENG